jgi:hypothetical protein
MVSDQAAHHCLLLQRYKLDLQEQFTVAQLNLFVRQWPSRGLL